MKGNYRLPTIGGLRVNEISQIAKLFYEEKNWKTVNTIYYENNISQTNKRTMASRYFTYDMRPYRVTHYRAETI